MKLTKKVQVEVNAQEAFEVLSDRSPAERIQCAVSLLSGIKRDEMKEMAEMLPTSFDGVVSDLQNIVNDMADARKSRRSESNRH